MGNARAVNKYKEQGDVYIGRGSKWGNPYTSKPLANTKAIYQCQSREDSVAKFREYLLNSPELLNAIPELIGKRLICVCKPQLCHGDVLAEFANHYEKFGYNPTK